MLYLVLLDYLRPLSEVDAHVEAHRAFLRRHFEAGHFLLSGPKVPRTGGVILAQARNEQEVSTWIAEDPFHQQGIARFEVIAWSATMSQPQWPLDPHSPA